LIEPVVADHDCQLVDVEVARNRGTGLLRVTVDNSNGDGRVAITRCVAISREVETLLDAADAMPGAYQLEVSSPGLDRVLGREKDFVEAISLEVKLRTRRPIEGRKRYRGRLVSVESGVLKVEVDGETVLIPIEDVEKANSIYEFTSADFAKESSRRGSSQSGGV
jgi:ribosome maturation factor RimP